MRRLLFVLVLCWPTLAHADYIQLSRSAVLRSEPKRDAESVATLNADDRVRLLKPTEDNGYYFVEVPDSGVQGWVYRTLGRRFRGDIPAPAGEEPDGGVHDEIRPTPGASSTVLSPAQQQLIDANCPEGMPVVTDHSLGVTRYVARQGYALEHSTVDKIPLWVCERLDAEQLSGSLTRDNNPFAPDPELPAGERAELADYRGTGYDRGHQAPAGDQTVNKELKDETFYLSNMAPQAKALNELAWARLEDLVRGWVRDHKVDQAKVITGPIFYDPSHPSGAIHIKTIGPDHIAVPTHFFKMVAARWRSDSQLHVIAFVMTNAAQPKPYDFASDIVSVQWVEQHTGLKFLPQLSEAERERLEQATPPLWFSGN